MTVFNTINEKETINETKLVDKGKWNTANKLKRRKISDLQGLKMDIVQFSFREKNTSVEMLNEARSTDGLNDFNKISRRKYGELDGLLVSIIEKSKIEITTRINKIKLVKPLKTYKNKIKLLFKYKINTKY